MLGQGVEDTAGNTRPFTPVQPLGSEMFLWVLAIITCLFLKPMADSACGNELMRHICTPRLLWFTWLRKYIQKHKDLSEIQKTKTIQDRART